MASPSILCFFNRPLATSLSCSFVSHQSFLIFVGLVSTVILGFLVLKQLRTNYHLRHFLLHQLQHHLRPYHLRHYLHFDLSQKAEKLHWLQLLLPMYFQFSTEDSWVCRFCLQFCLQCRGIPNQTSPPPSPNSGGVDDVKPRFGSTQSFSVKAFYSHPSL